MRILEDIFWGLLCLIGVIILIPLVVVAAIIIIPITFIIIIFGFFADALGDALQ